jgi:hypothetical protein
MQKKNGKNNKFKYQYVTTTVPSGYYTDLYGNLTTNDGTYIIPITDFSIEFDNPYYNYNPTNGYIKNVVEHIYFRLINFWLYEYRSYDRLLKYFDVNVSNGKGEISLVKTLADAKDSEIKDKYKKYILQHIENNYVNKKFVKTILTKYVKKKMIQWYDLILNEKVLIKLFYKKLKRKIEKLILGVEKKKTNFDT